MPTKTQTWFELYEEVPGRGAPLLTQGWGVHLDDCVGRAQNDHPGARLAEPPLWWPGELVGLPDVGYVREATPLFVDGAIVAWITREPDGQEGQG